MVNAKALEVELWKINAHLETVRVQLEIDARDKDTGLISAWHGATLARLDEAIRVLSLARDNVTWPNGKPGASDEGAKGF